MKITWSHDKSYDTRKNVEGSERMISYNVLNTY